MAILFRILYTYDLKLLMRSLIARVFVYSFVSLDSGYGVLSARLPTRVQFDSELAVGLLDFEFRGRRRHL
jgi:hypothetical protein